MALPTRLSSKAAGALTKRKPRAVNSRGSIRRSTRLSMEKRKPRSANAARLSCSIGPMPRTAFWVNSNTSDGAIARLASISSSSCGNPASVSVATERLQNRPISRFLRRSRLTTCTQRSTHRPSSLGKKEPRLGIRQKVRGGDDLAVTGIEPGHRFVIAHLALRQRHDRLQVEIDPLAVDGAGHCGDDGVLIKASESRYRGQCR